VPDGMYKRISLGNFLRIHEKFALKAIKLLTIKGKNDKNRCFMCKSRYFRGKNGKK